MVLCWSYSKNTQRQSHLMCLIMIYFMYLYIYEIIFLRITYKNDISAQVMKGWSVEFCVWHSDKFRSGHLRHIGREMEWREKSGGEKASWGAYETSRCAVNHTDSLERVNVTVLEIWLGEVGAWKTLLSSGGGRFLHCFVVVGYVMVKRLIHTYGSLLSDRFRYWSLLRMWIKNDWDVLSLSSGYS